MTISLDTNLPTVNISVFDKSLPSLVCFIFVLLSITFSPQNKFHGYRYSACRDFSKTRRTVKKQGADVVSYVKPLLRSNDVFGKYRQADFN
jgi:rRNA maturation protein Nop10